MACRVPAPCPSHMAAHGLWGLQCMDGLLDHAPIRWLVFLNGRRVRSPQSLAFASIARVTRSSLTPTLHRWITLANHDAWYFTGLTPFLAVRTVHALSRLTLSVCGATIAERRPKATRKIRVAFLRSIAEWIEGTIGTIRPCRGEGQTPANATHECKNHVGLGACSLSDW